MVWVSVWFFHFRTPPSLPWSTALHRQCHTISRFLAPIFQSEYFYNFTYNHLFNVCSSNVSSNVSNVSSSAPSSGIWTTTCGGEVLNDGIVYPAEGKYESNKDCTWTIRRSGPFLIRFQRFDLESHSTCRYDWVRVDDGTKMCGSTIPSEVRSTTANHSMVVEFHSDSGVTKHGPHNPRTQNSSRGVYARPQNTLLFDVAIQ